MNNFINIPEYEVSQFNKAFKEIVETNFNYIRIKGEISELKNASSGHIYITLKDDASVLNATIWSQKKNLLQIKPEIGMEVIVAGKVSTYAKSISTYSINIDKIELAGEGALLKLIEDRKKRLKSQGIFDEIHKKKLPLIPKKIGVITSATGSVIHDIINRIKDRFPRDIDIWPVPVQGANAVEKIIEAIRGFHHNSYYQKPDIIIIARGGGSIEDLMPFNDENLALEVFDSSIPIISAIGHETDTTIIDYVSDFRASTPTAAAEKTVPVLEDLEQKIGLVIQRLHSSVKNNYNENYSRYKNLSKFLKAPNFVIQALSDKLILVSDNLFRGVDNLLLKNYQQIQKLIHLLRSPQIDIKNKKQYLQNNIKNLDRSIKNKLINNRNEFITLDQLLKSNSINSALRKGYSIVRKSKKIVKKSNQINENDLIDIQFSDKLINIKVKKIS